MAIIKPFLALRPEPPMASKICALPYDVLTSDEARAAGQNNPLSFLHVSKPEIDLEPGIDPYSEAVYQKGRANFRRLIGDKALRQDSSPCYYLYRQVMGTHSQTGIVAVVSCEDYDRSVVKKHEMTIAKKEDDRVRHIEALNAQTGPAFLIHRRSKPIAGLIAARTAETPEVDFTADDGIRHSAWTVSSPVEIGLLEGEFARMTELYIADGHHRSAAAVRIWKTRQSSAAQPSAYFLAVIFSDDQLQILPCNRIVRDLKGLSSSAFVEQLQQLGSWQTHPNGRPSGQHEIGVFLDGEWHVMKWREELVAREDRVGRLDVALLQKYVLAPLLGIDNPRTSSRISFPGGIRGTVELEKAVRSGRYEVAFSLFPVKVGDVMAIVDQGGMMPPKSTWFEPKLRDGMFTHLLE
jgi:uncharacterized protein (DUF1015 family)